MPAATEDGPRQPTSEEITLSFVETELLGLGFNPFQAAALAEAHADWHRAERLIRLGCPHDVAVDILL